jgi:AraC-like DNA-binding protein
VDRGVEKAVNRAIAAMRERFGEELTIDELARTAMYSKFHFSRAFRQVTGVSPGRFLSAVRFQEAKRLLLSTSMSVAEISNRVGYSSLGTFSTRFKSSVGLSPTQYRRNRGFRPRTAGHRGGGASSATVRGRVAPPVDGPSGPTFVGLYPERVPVGPPVRCAVIDHPGPYVLEDVPAGTWYVLAHATVPGGPGIAGNGGGRDQVVAVVGTHGPITVRPGATVDPADVRLRPMRAADLPVLLAPPDAHPVAVGGNGD